ncbi:MAG: PAS domain S-box protein [Planctomycetaceae bacterium]|nr:PAS domain S-box protein [Planctomycetaceae bacterium]
MSAKGDPHRNAELLSSDPRTNGDGIPKAQAADGHRTPGISEDQMRLQVTLASIGDAVICTDELGRVTFLNPVAETLTGWPQADAEGQPLPSVFHIVNESTRQPVDNPALRALQEGAIVGLANHTVLIARDGTERPIDDSAAPIRDTSGRVIGAVLVFRDVTERKRAEVARARLAAIVESSQDAIASKTLEGTILTWNQGAERLFGYSAGEIVGRSIMTLIPPERHDEERYIIDQIRRGERVEHFETVRVAKDGRRIDISLTVSPIKNDEGEVVAASKIARDITARKQHERLLQETARRNKFLSDLAAATQPLTDPDAIMSTSARLLAEHLDVDRCAYAEVEDESVFVITGDHPRGVPSIVGRWPVAAFGTDVERLMRANEPYVVENIDTDPRAPGDLAAYRQTQIQAVICVPLHKGGRFTAAMAVHQKTPREWSADDVSLVLTVADRCWEALERARVTRNLSESESRYRTMVEATPECVKLVDADGTLLQMNRAGLAMVEAPAAGMVLGHCVYDVINPEYRDAFRAFNERVCRGESGTMEFEITGLRGTHRFMETTAVPIPAPDGRFHQMAITRDVTERKAAARALEESRNRLDYAVRMSGVGFWYCDLPFDVLNWDARVKEHFWLAADAQVTIETFYDRIHPEDRESTRQAIAASISHRTTYDVHYRTVNPATGDFKWIRALGGTVFGADGTPVRFDGVTLDVTAQKLDQIRLARAVEAEREHARLVREVAQASLTIHSSGSLDSVLRVIAGESRRIIGAHQAVSSLIDEDWNHTISTVAMSDKYAAWANYATPPNGRGIYTLVTSSNQPIRLTQAELESHPAWRNFSGEGEKHPPMRGWLAVPLIGRNGRNLGLIQLSDKEHGDFDETDESILVQLAHIASVAIENARLNDELRGQDRRKDEFLALLAHELRNPLAPLRNGVAILRLCAGPDDSQGEVLGIMERQLEHMVRLIDDLLDVSRISRNKIELRRQRIALADALHSAIETTRPILQSAGHMLEINLPSEPILLDADMTRLAQVFGNILHNAAKYSEPGGHITVTASQAGERAVVQIRDTGIGIPAAALPTIFDMFSQVERSLERSSGGLGIGLALVKGLVEMHGGTVSATSEGEGKGSCFTVRLPVLPRVEVIYSEPSASLGGSVGRHRRRMLIADDNRDAATSMAQMLRLMGNDVRIVHDGADAVEMASEFQPDVILMDIGMPRLNGHEATRQIRELPGGRAMKIVALTGWGQEADRARSREAGCDAHMTKPVDPVELKTWLDSN